MKMLLLPVSACLFLSVPALAMTDEDCATMWKQADSNNDGALRGPKQIAMRPGCASATKAWPETAR